jgi:hypothetical protein
MSASGLVVGHDVALAPFGDGSGSTFSQASTASSVSASMRQSTWARDQYRSHVWILLSRIRAQMSAAETASGERHVRQP